MGHGSVSKVVIPVAGLGTRFLPFTKSVPKEMLPVVDAPSILLLAEEAYNAGFSDIVLIQGRGKTSIEDFFDVSYELEHTLAQKNRHDLLERVLRIRDNINIISIRQQVAGGLGHAVLTARPVVGDSPFAVMLGDEILDSSKELERLRDIHRGEGASAVSIMEVERIDVSKYGIVEPESEKDGIVKIKSLVEKPSVDAAPSCYALPGRYIFEPILFEYLKDTKVGVGGELQLTDAMVKLAKYRGLFGVPVESKRYDLGDKFGFIKANIEFGLKDPDIARSLRPYLNEITKQLGS